MPKSIMILGSIRSMMIPKYNAANLPRIVIHQPPDMIDTVMPQTVLNKDPGTVEGVPLRTQQSRIIHERARTPPRKKHPYLSSWRSPKEQLEQQWQELEAAATQADDEAKAKLAALQQRWEKLDEALSLIGRNSRIHLRDDLNQGWQELRDMEDVLNEIREMRIRIERELLTLYRRSI